MNHVTLRAARPRAWLLSLLLASALALALCPPAGTRAAEVVDSCTEGALLSALQGGGEISFSCGGPATISLTRPLPISTDTVLDGGDQITLSGGGVTSVIKVAPGMGLHPSMVGFERLYKDGRLAVVHGCGYDHPSLSHFSSMDFWHTGAPNSGEPLGWLGRLADATYDPSTRAWTRRT